MANEEHLRILLSGVEDWNEWRRANPETKPDLVEAALQGADLLGFELSTGYWTDFQGVNLQGFNLQGAKLQGTKLREANLQGANLWEANLWGANLRGANLQGANLQGARLQEADLCEARLQEADLWGTNLQGAKLQMAQLQGINLQGTNLQGVDLRGANLQGVSLQDVMLQGVSLKGFDLQGADLRGADLREADLGNANLEGAKLQGARLQRANLENARLDKADLTEAKLWRAQTHDWSLKEVICESVSWDEGGQELTTYGPGEFERAYGTKTEIIVEFPGGMGPVEWALLPIKLEELQKKHPDSQINLRSIVDDGNGAKLTITVDDLAGRDREEFRSEVKLLQQELDQHRDRVAALLQEKQKHLITIETMAGLINPGNITTSPPEALPTPSRSANILNTSQPGVNITMTNDTYNIHGQAGAVGPNAKAEGNTFNQLWDQSKDNIDMEALAADLTKLREAMIGGASNDEELKAAIAVTEAEYLAQQKDGPKVMEKLAKAGARARDIAVQLGLGTLASLIASAIAG